MSKTGTCAECGTETTWSGKGPAPMYCSGTCRQAAHRKRLRAGTGTQASRLDRLELRLHEINERLDAALEAVQTTRARQKATRDEVLAEPAPSPASPPDGLVARATTARERAKQAAAQVTGFCEHRGAVKGAVAGTKRCPTCQCVRGADGIWR